MTKPLNALVAVALLAGAITLHAQQPATDAQTPEEGSFRFRTGVELINVTATVSDSRTFS